MSLVKLYMVPECPYCNMVREFLEERGVDFIEYDILNDPYVAEYLLKKIGSFEVPVLDIDGLIVLGFKAFEIERILSNKLIGGIVRR